eukprot:g1957.t1
MEDSVLATLGAGSIDSTLEFASAKGFDHLELIGLIKSLEGDAFVASEDLSRSFWVLTAEAEEVVATGSPEFRVFNAVPPEGIDMAALKDAVGAAVHKIGWGACMKAKWLRLDKATKVVTRAAETAEDSVAAQLKELQAKGGAFEALSADAAKQLKRRNLVTLQTLKYKSVSKGAQYAPKRVKLAADLTKEMLDSGAWKMEQFKPYNYGALGRDVGGGFLHPLLKVRTEFRKILLEMGFEEMPTNQWVESSFWNFDALFQPQSHPARDAHDTFFLKGGAARTLRVPEDYYERVKAMHERGGSGSIGYRYDFDRGEAFKNLLRTHTTAWSSQMLYRLAQSPGGFKPSKYFSIDRVFRNETMDATHLCEFHQVEGWVADYNLSLGDLIGTINAFFNKIGITQIRFKPAFNPYTEPSMEIFAYHPTLKKWTEVGNSGMFRPEMLAPMGLPENVRVIAWGLSVERPTMIKYDINNIRTLFGHKIDLTKNKTAPVCRLDR